MPLEPLGMLDDQLLHRWALLGVNGHRCPNQPLHVLVMVAPIFRHIFNESRFRLLQVTTRHRSHLNAEMDNVQCTRCMQSPQNSTRQPTDYTAH